MTPRFTLADVEAAHDGWRANCGPTALAAICGLTLDEVRPHMGANWPGHTNPTCMFSALRSLGRRWSAIQRGVNNVNPPWPRYGLCRIQWLGPWTQPGANPRWAYRQTHWVGAARGRPPCDASRSNHDIGIWDVNALGNGTGWCALADWTAVLVPALTAGIPRASGGWHITHAIEVER